MSMNIDDVKAAVAEAERFIAKGKVLIEADNSDWRPCEERAAARRASLDLTKALAKMRARCVD